MNQLIDENLIIKRSFLPEASFKILTDSELHGRDGYVRIHNHFDWFRNYITITDRLYQGSTEHFNRGSLIDYLNAKSEGTGKVELKKGFLGWIGGSSEKEILERYQEIVGKETRSSTSSNLQLLWEDKDLLIHHDEQKKQIYLVTKKNKNVFQSLSNAYHAWALQGESKKEGASRNI